MFKSMKFYFHTAKLSRTRQNLFATQVTKHGGQVVSSSELATHIIVEETSDHSSLPVSLWAGDPSVVGTLWLSQCLKSHTVLDQQLYIVNKPVQKRSSVSPDPPFTSKKQAGNTSSDIDIQKYACSQSSSASSDSCNAAVLSQLKRLAETYRARGDQWRAHGYEKAISAIRRHGKEIISYEEVASLEGVGAKMASKVMEVISTGKIRKVQELCETEQSRVLDLFSNVWGAGPSTANAWYIKGHRTLNDLIEKETLTKQQQIGVKYYKEFSERMSRSEVEEIGRKVTEVALQVDASLATVLCGSYRRGKVTCGDVDVVVIKPDRLNSKTVLTSILAKLKESGFITDDLVSLEKNGNQRKYLGVCKLPGDNRIHRRLDIFVVPESETACAIMHYTGSALFNRSIRQLAAKRDMHLSEHNLAAGVIRQGSEIQNRGHILLTPTEASIFKHLNLEYRPPEERDH
uniref:DNA polymerase n=1 Tax=Graphocephala atropunctata TaxID=36148 RepID=A0A1B6LW89_9HEMI